MTTCLEKSCSYGLLLVSFVNVYQVVCMLLFSFGFVGVMWDLIVLVLNRSLSIFCFS